MATPNRDKVNLRAEPSKTSKKLAEIKRLYPVWFLAAAGVFFGGAAAFFRTFVDWTSPFLAVLCAVLMIAGFSFGLLLGGAGIVAAILYVFIRMGA